MKTEMRVDTDGVVRSLALAASGRVVRLTMALLLVIVQKRTCRCGLDHNPSGIGEPTLGACRPNPISPVRARCDLDTGVPSTSVVGHSDQGSASGAGRSSAASPVMGRQYRLSMMTEKKVPAPMWTRRGSSRRNGLAVRGQWYEDAPVQQCLGGDALLLCPLIDANEARILDLIDSAAEDGLHFVGKDGLAGESPDRLEALTDLDDGRLLHARMITGRR